MKIGLPEGKMIQCTPITGKGKGFSSIVGKNGTIIFNLAEKNSFALYRYQMK
jgi:hypothetical protein